MLFYIYYQIVYIKTYQKKKNSLYKVAISHKTYWHPSTKFISDRFSVKDGVLRHWTTNRLPCGSHAIPRPRPHKPDDEPLQVTILKKNTVFSLPLLSLRSGSATSAPIPNPTTSALPPSLTLSPQKVWDLLTSLASTKLWWPRWKLPLWNFLISLSTQLMLC